MGQGVLFGQSLLVASTDHHAAFGALSRMSVQLAKRQAIAPPRMPAPFAAMLAGSEVLDSQESMTKFYCWNLGITSLAKSSIERNTLECSMLPKDILAPKYPMPCSSRNLVIRCTHCSGVPK